MISLSPDFFRKPPPESEKLGFGRTNLTGFFQRFRGKQNIEYVSPEGIGFIAKYCKYKEGRRNVIKGLENEKLILDKLEPTGITPKAGGIKYYPSEDNPKKARLLIETLNAISLDRLEVGSVPELNNSAINEIVRSAFRAYQTIHEAGVYQVDVNLGNLMIQDSDDGLGVRLIDFELGLNTDSHTIEDLESTFRFLSEDYSIKFNPDLPHNVDTLKKAEIYNVAMTVVKWILGETHLWKDIDLLDGENREYETMVDEVRPNLEAEIVREAKKEHQERIANNRPFSGGEEGLVDYHLRNTLPFRIRNTTISCTLEARLRKKGIELDYDLIEFLKRALMPNIEDRPVDFL